MGGFHGNSAAHAGAGGDDTTDNDLDGGSSYTGAGVVQSAAATARGLGAAVASSLSAATGLSVAGVRATAAGGATYSALPAAGASGANAGAISFKGTVDDSDDDPLLAAAAARTGANNATGAAAASVKSNGGGVPSAAFDDESSGAEHISIKPNASANAVNGSGITPVFGKLPPAAPAAAADLSAYAASAIPLPPRGEDDEARTKAAFNLLDE